MGGGRSPAQPPPEGPAPPPPLVFTFPNRIVFGVGSLRTLPDEIRRLNVTRPLVVADPGIVASGLADAVLRLLDSPLLFTDVEANPTEADVLAGAERFRS